MDKKELDLELDKIHENKEGDEIYIPNSLAEEMLDREIKKGIEKLTN